MNIDDDEFGEPEALTAEEYSQVKALFARGVFEIELSGEDLVLNADCVDEALKLDPIAAEGTMVREIARVKFKRVIAHSVQLAIEEVEEDAARSEIFAISSRLRELAALVEEEAGKLDTTEWDKYSVPVIQPDEEAEARANED